MRNVTDEAYADNPALAQSREALRTALQQAGRLIAADLDAAVPPLKVAEALDHSMDALVAVVDSHRAMIAAGSEVVPYDLGREHHA